uniref:BTB domain-containing protein n=1 Tax=Timema tahoe TaxID=61484 RepID=A0A7R9IEB3_9NEOP|nr:unnamed protein product [Timema tahoe]
MNTSKAMALTNYDDVLATSCLIICTVIPRTSVIIGIQGFSQQVQGKGIKLQPRQLHLTAVIPAEETPAPITSNTELDLNFTKTSPISCEGCGSCPCTTMGSNQQFSLRWNNYLRHITNAFDSLRSDEDLVDVTLSCEGKRIRAHKMLLSACSTYFRDLFKENPCQHPVIIFRSVKFEDLSALIDFMYQGEVNVVQDQLASFLTTAELLAVQGLSDGRDAPGPTGDDEDDIKEIEIPDSPGTPKEPEVPVIKPTKKTVPASAGASNVRVSSPQAQQYPDKKPSAQYTDKKPPAQTASAPSSSSEPTAHPPAPKRRKWSAEKATPSPAPRNLAPSPDPIEVIPVMPNLKVEAPDYCELGDDDGSYGDSNSGPGGGPDPMAQLLDSKQDFSELYSTNSRDSSLTQSESFLASDLSQLLSKPGPSGENQSQDSLQGEYSEVLSLRPLHPGCFHTYIHAVARTCLALTTTWTGVL